MNSILSILKENIYNSDSLFVFPTDISSSRWADYLLRETGGSIPMNKFTAWDVFKQNSIKSTVQKKKSVPSALRKIFTSRLLKENADNICEGKDPLFTSLILTQWASGAAQFSPWLASILPQLGSWFEKITGLSIHDITSKDEAKKQRAEKAGSSLTGDFLDMFVLAKRYALFLEEHSLFEHAWETPPFNNDGKEVFIFFPESLSDYGEYKEILTQSNHVKIISASDTADLPCDSFFYTNSRSEIAEACLYIRALNETQGIPWDSIAVSICDPDKYEPYVLREFKNRNIPFVKRTSKALDDITAGSFFRCLLDCASQDFSFSSVVSLVMNRKLPWKEYKLIDELINFGINNNCLYSWSEKEDDASCDDSFAREKKINVWEDAFKKPYDFYHDDIKRLFNELKKRVLSIRNADSFAELRKQYFIFREYFFEMENCSDETDLILSRCISELMNLTELEKSFPDVRAVDPFLFFTEYLSEVNYLPQTKSSGIAVLPYKTAAAAPFDCHIILNSSQDGLSVIYSRLDFLPRKKREELGLKDEDASSSFINMHKYNSLKSSAFFCCEKSFSGFTIPHSKINAPSEPRDRYASDELYSAKFSPDLYKDELNYISSLSAESNIANLHDNQIEGFTEWKSRRLSESEIRRFNIFEENDKIQKIIDSKFSADGKYKVSATSLKKYYQCSLKWLFESVFSLETAQIETSMMSETISGLVYHAVLNNFFGELKENRLMEPVKNNSNLSLPDDYSALLEESINKTFNNFPSLNKKGATEMSSITSRILNAGKKDYHRNLEKALAQFLSYFAGCEVYATEKYYSLENDSHIMNGFVDLILKEKDDQYIIIDFKLKNLPSREDCTAEDDNELADFQLPMYITLTEENEKIKIYTALFFSIIGLNPEIIIGEQITPDSECYNNIFKEFNLKKNQFIKEISNGSFSVFPPKNSSCNDCDYNRICRTSYIIDRENITLGKH